MSDEKTNKLDSLISNVKPIKQKQPSKLYIPKTRKTAKIDNAESFIHAPISQTNFDINHDDELYFRKAGTSEDTLNKMSKGKLSPIKSIDLHGMTVNEAEIYIFSTIDCIRSNRQTVIRIVHGKGYSTAENPFPKMKNFVARYLSQHPRVHGFVSCPIQYGGTGAVYVLIQKE